jgi:hypothetical protein
VLGAIVSDLGGADRLSEGQKQLCRRCALLAIEAEKLEARSISGEDIDVDRFGCAASAPDTTLKWSASRHGDARCLATCAGISVSTKPAGISAYLEL